MWILTDGGLLDSLLWMFEGENKQRDIERHVDEFIADNQDQWDAWLAAAKAAE